MSSLFEGLVIGLHLVSLHTAGDLQPVNPGAYVRLEGGLTAGAFRNSYDRDSAYVAQTFETGDRRFALTVGAVTGYPARDVLPMVVPSVRVGLAPDLSARVSYLPKPPGSYGRTHCLHLSLERAF